MVQKILQPGWWILFIPTDINKSNNFDDIQDISTKRAEILLTIEKNPGV
jgi:hypothetical protein